MNEEIRELQDLKLKSQDRLTRFTRPLAETEFIRDVDVTSDVASGVTQMLFRCCFRVTMSKKIGVKKIDSPAKEAGKIQSNNPIYGIANGGNTCFCIILQVIFNIPPPFGKMLEDL